VDTSERVEDYKGVKATASMTAKEQVDVNENQVAHRDLVNGRWMTRLVEMNRTGTTVSLRGSPHTKEAFSFSICFVCVAAARPSFVFASWPVLPDRATGTGRSAFFPVAFRSSTWKTFESREKTVSIVSLCSVIARLILQYRVDEDDIEFLPCMA
jgi:hypothetical protein